MTDDTTTEPDPGEETPRRPRVVLLLAALLVVTCAALAVVSTGYVHQRHDASDARDAAASRESALNAAKRFAVDFSTYDYTTLDATFEKVAAELTGDFKSQYQATSASLKATLQKYKGKATATVQGAGVTTASASRASVVVLLDQSVTSTASPTARVDRSRMVITLTRVGGTWLMSDLDLK
jgi:Mce-associated membrane protein